MFEMKNEMDTTSTKKKNEDFLKELDKDRREKNCEYAVLVSLLEPESELYNAGIVDMSHRYPKMYVIRPQFFIPIITLLRNAASNSLEYKRELEIIKAQNVDVSNFKHLSGLLKSLVKRVHLYSQTLSAQYCDRIFAQACPNSCPIFLSVLFLYQYQTKSTVLPNTN